MDTAERHILYAEYRDSPRGPHTRRVRVLSNAYRRHILDKQKYIYLTQLIISDGVDK